MIRAAVSAVMFIVYTLIGIVSAFSSRLWDRSGDTVVWLARQWSRAILATAGVKVNVIQAAPLDANRPYVFMSNHISALDIWSLYAAVKVPMRMMAKKQLGDIPLFGWAMHAGRFLFIDRQNATSARRSIDLATRRIHDGVSVLIFPEGTRSRDGKMAPFKKGGFYLAIDSGAAIVPVAVRGARELFPPGSVLLRRGEVTIEIAAPIPTDGMTGKDRDRLVLEVQNQIQGMSRQELSQ